MGLEFSDLILKKIIFNQAKNTHLLISYCVPTPSIYCTAECLLSSWYGSGHAGKARDVGGQGQVKGMLFLTEENIQLGQDEHKKKMRE